MRGKAVILIIDGAAGWPDEVAGGMTALEAARTPNLDRLACTSTVGMVQTVPDGMEPSSAVACMSVLGFDPRVYYAGRGPIEALALGIALKPGQAALRCNLVTVLDGLMSNYTSGHIPSAESHQLIRGLNGVLGTQRIVFHPGTGFRHILTVEQGDELLRTLCTPPHDIPDQPVVKYLPKGPGADLLLDLIEGSIDYLALHPVNQARVQRGEPPATQIWPFWPGMQAREMPSFASRYAVRAALTTSVDLLRGIGRQVSLQLLDIAGVADTNINDFAGQMKGALAALDEFDAVVVHVEAPDEAGHAGNLEDKLEAIELVDELMVSQVMRCSSPPRLLVLPDHPTPLAVRTHVGEPVPFLMWEPGGGGNGATAYSESAGRRTGLVVAPGHLLMGRFLGISE
ncbi:MAG: cofactor-independent phosphoglycerate mutase [Gaiellales bacterium]|nr:cofactor-independent phosphoglycerate mutase [Gaiellales bacterium]